MDISKKMIGLIIIMIVIGSFPLTKPASAFSVSASTAVLMEQQSGRVLYDKGMHEKRRIASITKIMTAILAIESGKMDEMVSVSNNAWGTEGSSIYLKKGEQIKLEDLVYGLMLRSGNDAAVAIAEHVGGSLDGFVYLMNEKVKMIGMRNTVFANPHGLDDHENHYSTAYDMAILTRYAMENKTYREISSTKVHKAPNPSEKWDRVWRNKNKLLTKLYKHSTGGKTGYTKRAKRTLVSTASHNGLDLISVTLNGPNDWNDHIHMFEWAFKNFKLIKVIPKGSIDDLESDFYEDRVFVHRDVYYPLTKKEQKDIEVQIKLLKPKEEWERNTAPEPVGKMYVKLKDKPIAELPLFLDGIPKQNQSWWSTIKNLFFIMVGVEGNG